MEIVVPDGCSGGWRVETFEVSETDSAFTRMRAMMHPGEYVPAGTYKRLMRGREVVMSNTPMEVATNQPIIRRATGIVHINGLGLGMVLTAILKKPEVSKVYVVEKSADVISLVAPSFKCDPRVSIIHCDALSLKPAKVRFDCVWHDIWDNVCSDNLHEMHVLHRMYGRKTNWQGSWERDRCEYLKRRY